MGIAAETGLHPSLMHRVAVIASGIAAGSLDSLPHNGAVVTMLAFAGCMHHEKYRDIVMVAVVGFDRPRGLDRDRLGGRLTPSVGEGMLRRCASTRGHPANCLPRTA